MMIKNLKSNHLTNATLFKRPGGKSWTLLKNTNQIVVHEENQATNWDKYIKACQDVGDGYTIDTYKRLKGIKGAKINKNRKPDSVNAFAQGFIKFGIEQGYIK